MNKRVAARLIRQAKAEFAAFEIDMKQYDDGVLVEVVEDRPKDGGGGAGSIEFKHLRQPETTLRLSDAIWRANGEIVSYGHNYGKLTL